MQRTKTTILFPDASDPNIPPIRKGSVTISGNINNVYMARQMLVVNDSTIRVIVIVSSLLAILS
jgi:hypothetical protein